MDSMLALMPILVPLALVGVLLASVPTGIEILRRGNEADPLRKEIEEERREREDRDRAA